VRRTTLTPAAAAVVGDFERLYDTFTGWTEVDEASAAASLTTAVALREIAVELARIRRMLEREELPAA
jgi:hypothetical protein